MKRGWTEVSLGEVCTFLSGGTPSRQRSDYFDGSIPWITGADITGPVAGEHRTTITEAGLKSSPANVVPAGTVLLVTRTSVGKVAVCDRPLSFSQDITAILSDEGRVNKGYLVHALAAKAPELKRRARGATILGVTRADVAEIELPLPPLEEQTRIAAILDKADELEAKRRAAAADLESLAKAIFLDMFGDPVTNSRGWPVVNLADLGTLDRGVSKHRPRNDPSLLGGPYPLVQTGDVTRSGGYITDFEATYSEAGLAQSRLWPAGTLCITIAANIARTGILTFEACFPDSVVGFTAEPWTTEYIRLVITFHQRYLETAAPESAQKNINLAVLRSLEVPSPPADLLRQLLERLERVHSDSKKQITSMNALSSLSESLRARAFRGEL